MYPLGARGSVGMPLGNSPVSLATSWWLAGGISAVNCVAAYGPKGAASYDASKINLANPGTYTAAPGSDPGWGATTGWTATASQYLIYGFSAATVPVTVLVRVIVPTLSTIRVITTSDLFFGWQFRFLTTGKFEIQKRGVGTIGTSITACTPGAEVLIGFSYDASRNWIIYYNGAIDNNGTAPTSSALSGSGVARFSDSTSGLASSLYSQSAYNIILPIDKVAAVSAAMP